MADDLEKYAATPSSFEIISENPEKYEEPIKISEVLLDIHPKYSSETITIDGDTMIIRLPLKEKMICNP